MGNRTGTGQALKDYDDGLERYIPVLMAMARIYWDRENYPMVSQPVALTAVDTSADHSLRLVLRCCRGRGLVRLSGIDCACLSLLPATNQVEKLFRQSAEFCSEHEVWKLNVAHVFFMQVGLFPDSCTEEPAS